MVMLAHVWTCRLLKVFCAALEPHPAVFLMTLNDFVSVFSPAEAMLRVSSQRVSGYEGSNITIHCHGASRWCNIRGSCFSRDGGPLKRTAVHDDDDDDDLRVTLWQLQKEDSGWYYCSNEDSQMPVHVTVMEVLGITQLNSSKRDTLT